MRNHRQRSATLLIAALIMAIIAGCGAGSGTPTNANGGGNATQGSVPAADDNTTEPNGVDPSASHPVVTIEMVSGDIITAELYPEVAPNTVNNFISLIEQGFYDGTVFHRVIPGFMIQGGDPQGTGAGGPGYSIAGEFTNNRFPNDLKHERGVLSMARAQSPDSAGSQFFIMVAEAPSLDEHYAAFGKVTDGMEAVDAIVNLPRGAQDRPKELPVMKKVTVDTLGVDYDEPITIE